MNPAGWIGLAALILAAGILAHHSCPACQQRWNQVRGWWWGK